LFEIITEKIKEPKLTGEELVALREKAGLTQADVAAALNVHPITIARWERRNGASLPKRGAQIILAYFDRLKTANAAPSAA
jgi:DNA-binding transcriptional regulator YiaG